MQETESVLRAFGIKGAINQIALFGYGHINDSYKVKLENESLLLQRINTSIFELDKPLEQNLVELFSLDTSLFPHHFKANNKIHFGDKNGLWRLSAFIENSYSPLNPGFEETLEAVKGYGQFMALNHSLDVDEFAETIPHFHHLGRRLNCLAKAAKVDKASRVDEVQKELNLVEEFSWIEEQFAALMKADLPLRVCHNDTKSTNVLLDETSKALLKVVDLDTVGPGYALYDFGDMMRSMLASHPENEPDIESLEVLEDRFEHMLETYIESSGGLLTKEEIDSLGFGGLYMTYIMAIRFLTDYLNGDTYYRIAYPDENLVRAKNQLKLLGLIKGMMNL